MGVYQRADSKYWWMILDGTTVRTSTRIPLGDKAARKDSRSQAEEIYRAAMGDLARGTFKLPTTKKTRTFRDHAEWYRDNVSKTHRCFTREKSIINELIRVFGDQPLSELTTAAIETWRLDTAKRKKQSTVNRELEVLKPMLARAVPEFLETNPAGPVKRFKLRYPPIAILSPEAEAKLLAHATAAERAFVLLGLDALLRCGDARRLNAKHDHGTYIDVIDPKTEPYKVPVSTRLRAALDALWPKDGYYFPRLYGDQWAPMNRVTAFYLFQGLCERANVPYGRAVGGITYHGLRHTGATRAARAVKLTVVQRLGGWKSLKQLGRYDHPEDPEIVRAVEAISHSRPTHGRSGTRKNTRKKAG